MVAGVDAASSCAPRKTTTTPVAGEAGSDRPGVEGQTRGGRGQQWGGGGGGDAALYGGLKNCCHNDYVSVDDDESCSVHVYSSTIVYMNTAVQLACQVARILAEARAKYGRVASFREGIDQQDISGIQPRKVVTRVGLLLLPLF